MIEGVKCDKCLVELSWEQALEHFEGCDRHTVAYINLLRGILTSDVRHQQPMATTTNANACPRQEIIKRYHSTYIHPDSMMPRALGTTLHKAMEEAVPLDDKWITERCTCIDPLPLPADADVDNSKLSVKEVDGLYHMEDCQLLLCRMSGTVFGIQVSGLVDAFKYIDKENKIIDIYDFKFRSQYAARYSSEVKPADVVQMNINRILAEQQGYTVRNMYIAAYYWSKEGLVEIPHVTEVEMENMITGLGRDGGSPPTAGDTLRMTAKAYEDIKGNEDKWQNVVRKLPLVGREKYRAGSRSMCTDYCDVADICRAIGTEETQGLYPPHFDEDTGKPVDPDGLVVM